MTVLPPSPHQPPGGRSDLEGELGWEGEGSASRGSGTFPPHRAPVSPFRLRKKSECVSRRLRLSSSTKVRGPLAPARPSKVSSSSHQPDHTRAARGAIFLLQRNQAPGHRKCPFRGRPIKARCLGVPPGSDSRSPEPGIRSRCLDGEARGTRPEVSLWEAGSRHTIGESGARSRPPTRGKGSILERQLCGRGQSVGPRALGFRPLPAPARVPAGSCLLFLLALVWAAASRSGFGPEVS